MSNMSNVSKIWKNLAYYDKTVYLESMLNRLNLKLETLKNTETSNFPKNNLGILEILTSKHSIKVTFENGDYFDYYFL